MCKRASGGRSDGLTTGAQASYLQALCEEAGESFNANFTKADASKRIDELRHKAGRGERRNLPPRRVFSSKAIVRAVLRGWWNAPSRFH